MRLGTIQRISIREVAEDLFIKHTQSGGKIRSSSIVMMRKISFIKHLQSGGRIRSSSIVKMRKIRSSSICLQSGGEFRITKEAEDGAGFLLQSSSSQNSSVDKSVE